MILKIVKFWTRIVDIFFIPLTVISAIWMKIIRIGKNKNFPISWIILKKIKVVPIINHYYEPLIDEKLMKNLDLTNGERNLAGINYNIEEQIELLDSFYYQKELLQLERTPFVGGEPKFYYNNDMIGHGDSEYLYCMIRTYKPSRIIEIGSGFSTLMSLEAIKKNRIEENIECKIYCIEPYENLWLEKTEAIIIRRKVEEVDAEIFDMLQENDILFIDSSHIIRPDGDVLFEYLELLPQLNKGVIIHIHDIFTPKHYSDEWMFNSFRFWNEQYLLEAFLTNNDKFKILGMCNYLKNNYWDMMKNKFPYIENKDEPGSFWIIKIK